MPGSRVVGLLVAGLLGASVAVLPSLAAGDAPSSASFTAVDSGFAHTWEADGTASTQATIAEGGTVTFSYPSGTSMHNVDFGSGPQPSSCTQTSGAASGTVPPLPHVPTAPAWSGTCTFAAAGTYSFHCDFHTTMTGTVVVQAPGMTTGTTATGTTGTAGTTNTTGTTTTTAPPDTTPTSTAPTSTAPTAASPATTTTGTGTTTVTAPAGSPLAGPTGIAIVFAARQRGTSVHGLVRISAAGAGYRMTVSVLAPRRALSHSHRGGSLEVGRAGVATLKTGTVHVTVRLDTAARRALARGRRLLLTVEVVLSRTGSERVLVARHVLLRP